jgi:hypothetical protein
MKVKAHKIELVVLDFNCLSLEDVKVELEDNRYLSVRVLGGVSKDISEWEDDHLLNKKFTSKEQIEEFFNKP